MTLLLDVAPIPVLYFLIPPAIIALVIAAIGAAVFFLVRALLKKKSVKDPEQK